MGYTLFDALGQNFDVGDIVMLPCVVTSIDTSPVAPAVQEINMTAKYANPDGSTKETFQVFATTVVKQ